MIKPKKVNEFKAGDKIRACGYDGTVTEAVTENCDDIECTYLKIKFDDNSGLAGTPYDNGWYGGSNNLVSYGGFEQ